MASCVEMQRVIQCRNIGTALRSLTPTATVDLCISLVPCFDSVATMGLSSVFSVLASLGGYTNPWVSEAHQDSRVIDKCGDPAQTPICRLTCVPLLAVKKSMAAKDHRRACTVYSRLFVLDLIAVIQCVQQSLPDKFTSTIAVI